MRATVTGVVTLVFLGALTSVAGQQTTTSTIAGRVFRSDTVDLFGDVAVSLELAGKDVPEDKRKVAEVKTDAKGNYSFLKVAPGAYTISTRVIFGSDREAPCPVASTGLNLFPESNADGWEVFMIRSNVGVIEGIHSMEFSIAGGQTVKKDIDLKCK